MTVVRPAGTDERGMVTGWRAHCEACGYRSKPQPNRGRAEGLWRNHVRSAGHRARVRRDYLDERGAAA